MRAMRLPVVAVVLMLVAALHSAQAKEGDPCFHRRLKMAGVCRQLSDCASQGADQRQQCAFRRGDAAPTVCCAAPDAAPATPATGATGATPTRPGSNKQDSKAKGPRPASAPLAQGCSRALDEAEDSDLTVQRRHAGRGKPPGTVARAMCRQYARYACERKRVTYPFNEITVVDYCESHNRTDQLIVGGREARSKEYPHMALLGYGDIEEMEYLCGGTIISPRFVLTAAHCVFSGDQPARWVVVGARERSHRDHPGARTQLITVAERIKHPDFKPPHKYNDIALLRLTKDISFEDGFARPACLGTEPRAEQHHKTATATGWGLTDWDGEQSSVLMTVTMNMTSLASCQKSYSINSQGIPKGVLESHLCAGSPGKDSCEGDSGGPLQLFPTDPYCMFHVVGVVSFGQFCGFNTPGVYTRVAAFLPWIEGIVWPAAPAAASHSLPPVLSQ